MNLRKQCSLLPVWVLVTLFINIAVTGPIYAGGTQQTGNIVQMLKPHEPLVDVDILYSKEHRGAVSEGFKASLALDTESDFSGVTFLIVIRNVTSQKLHVVDSSPANDCSLLIQRSNGEIIPCKERPWDITRCIFTSVEPGDIVVTEYLMFPPDKMPPDDTYRITAARHIPKLDGKGLSAAISNTIEVTIENGKVKQQTSSSFIFADAYLHRNPYTADSKKLITALKSDDYASAVSMILNLESSFQQSEDAQLMQYWIARIPISNRKILAVELESKVRYNGDLIFARLILASIYASLDKPYDAARNISRIITIAKGDEFIYGQVERMLNNPVMKLVKASLRNQLDEVSKCAKSVSSLADKDEKDIAVAKAQTLMRRWPKSYMAILSARRVFEKFEQWNEAIAVEEALLSRSTDPRDDGTLSYIADLYAKAGRHSDAIQALRKIISQSSSDSARLEAFRDIIRVYIKQNDYDNVAKTVIESERIIDDTNMEIQVVHTCTFEGMNNQSLTKSLETALGDASGLPATRFLLGTLYGSAGRIDDARKTFSRAVDEANGDRFTLRWIADNCLGEGLKDLGLQVAMRNYLSHPDEPYIALTAFKAHKATGGIVEAIVLAKLMISRWPNEWMLMANLGYMLDGLQQWDDAIAAWKNAADSAGKIEQGLQESMLLDLASTYRKAGHMADAVEVYKHLISTAKNKVVLSSAEQSLREIKSFSE